MRVKDARSLKQLAKNLSETTGTPSYLIIQNYMLERIVQRIAQSDYRDSLIIKGGFLLSSIVGIDTRLTRDLDSTYLGDYLTSEQVTDIFKEILSLDIGDNTTFTITRVVPIVISESHPGTRLNIDSNFDGVIMHLSIDVVCSDETKIRFIDYRYPMIFDNEYISIMSYSLERILAEKTQAILSRNITTTRTRDFYDVYIIGSLCSEKINYERLKDEITNVMGKRGTLKEVRRYKALVNDMLNSEYLHRLWNKYQKEYPYAAEITFDETLRVFSNVLGKAV